MKRYAVIASLKPAVDENKAILSAYECPECNTQLSSNLPAPNCMFCGHSELNEIEVEESAIFEENFTDSDSLAAVKCTSCEAFNIMPDDEVSALEGSMHCTACGEGLHILSSDMQLDEAEPADCDDEMTDDYGADVDTYDFDDDGDCPDMEEDQRISDEESGVELTAGDVIEPPKAPRSESYDRPSQNLRQTRRESYDDADIQEEIDQLLLDMPERPDSYDDQDPTTAELKQYINLCTVHANNPVSILMTEDAIHLVAESNVIVATLTREDAGVNQDIFLESRFHEALDRVLTDEGLAEVVSSFNFKPAIIEIPVSNSVQMLVDEQVSRSEALVTSKLKEQDDEFLQCLSIAAAGMNKGFFVDTTNPLYTGLINELSTVIEDDSAEEIVSAVFSSLADEYNTTLIKKARELSTKPEEVLNQLSIAISNTNAIKNRKVVDIGSRLTLGATPVNSDAIETSSIKRLKPVLVESKVGALHKAAQRSGGLFGKLA